MTHGSFGNPPRGWLACWLGSLLALVSRPQIKSTRKKIKSSKPRRRPRRKSPQHGTLENELVRLLNGNAATANRLIVSTRRKNPHQSEQWCHEKALYDLERDRR